MSKLAVLVALGILPACTTLGPMPATTGVTAVPLGRPGVQAQVGVVPGFYASQSAQNESKGAPIQHLSGLVDFDRWLPVKGVIVGARIFGQSGDTPGEPYIGYRKQLGNVSVAGVGFGSSKRTTDKLASYHGFRLGAEGVADAVLYQPRPWIGLHAQAAASVTRITASGNYCVDTMGIAVDCDEDKPATNVMISGKDSGVYPAATGQLAIDIGPHHGFFDSARLALLGGVGTMPLIVDGKKQNTGTYFTLGLTLSVGLGLGEDVATRTE